MTMSSGSSQDKMILFSIKQYRETKTLYSTQQNTLDKLTEAVKNLAHKSGGGSASLSHHVDSNLDSDESASMVSQYNNISSDAGLSEPETTKSLASKRNQRNNAKPPRLQQQTIEIERCWVAIL